MAGDAAADCSGNEAPERVQCVGAGDHFRSGRPRFHLRRLLRVSVRRVREGVHPRRLVHRRRRYRLLPHVARGRERGVRVVAVGAISDGRRGH